MKMDLRVNGCECYKVWFRYGLLLTYDCTEYSYHSGDDGNNINSFLLALHHNDKGYSRIDVPVSHAPKNILCSRATYCRINHLNILASLRMRVIPINLFPYLYIHHFSLYVPLSPRSIFARERCDEWHWRSLGSTTVINERTPLQFARDKFLHDLFMYPWFCEMC